MISGGGRGCYAFVSQMKSSTEFHENMIVEHSRMSKATRSGNIFFMRFIVLHAIISAHSMQHLNLSSG